MYKEYNSEDMSDLFKWLSLTLLALKANFDSEASHNEISISTANELSLLSN